ncbi:hypothetical protein MCC01971_15490 [Bifidobacteriaceae bacterium MCC01971]|nr:hypothetical protein MCC01971_15490 [Bifidobacteriaceae bacterium MCC01971]
MTNNLIVAMKPKCVTAYPAAEPLNMDNSWTPTDITDLTLPCNSSGVLENTKPITIVLYKGKGSPIIIEQSTIA